MEQNDTEHTKCIGKYKNVKKIGRGGFAIVHKAHDITLERDVALKVLHPFWSEEPEFFERFQLEARAAARLSHPNIVTVYETGEFEGELYIAMEYIPGCSLQELLETKGVHSLEEALSILEQLAEALDYAHTHNMVHRDVKPANVMIEETALGIHARLTDFGLVRVTEEFGKLELTPEGKLLGTPEYMAPEQADDGLASQVGPAADRYALGVIAYRMLTGRVPFSGTLQAIIKAHASKKVPRPRDFRPNFPRRVETVLLKMLEKDPQKRFVSASNFVAQLKAELEAHQQEQILVPLYRQMKDALEREDWTQALSLATRIETEVPNYRDVTQLREQALQGQQEQVLAPLYRQMRDSVKRKDWIQVLDMTAQILAKDDDYRDVSEWRGRAVQAMRLLPWLWASIGGGLALLMSFGLVAVIESQLFSPIFVSSTTPTVSSTRVSAPILTITPTSPLSTVTHTPTEVPTLSPTPVPLTIVVTNTREDDDMVMVYVPRGTFEMGSAAGHSDEKPEHTVVLDEFWIDKYEVTNAQFAAFLNDRGNQSEGGTDWLDINDSNCLIQQSRGGFEPKSGSADHPVIQVSWYGAAAYCEWVGGRLPTEAEWEYAARGPQGHTYPWGNDMPTCELAQFSECPGDTIPVGNLPDGASWVGAMDMSGNVWEWVADWYDSEYYEYSPVSNPTGPLSGRERVLRGGSWDPSSRQVYGFTRSEMPPSFMWYSLGFRCARSSR